MKIYVDKAVNIENYTPVDETDIGILGREVMRQVV